MAAAEGEFSFDMSLSSDLAGVDNRLECNICLDLYVKPKLLPCSHTFCEPCLEKLAARHRRGMGSNQEQRFPCPDCRATVVVPKNGVSGFNTNFYIADDVERMRARQMCNVCSDTNTGRGNRASSFCQDCKYSFCKECLVGHSRYFSHHRICPLSNSASVTMSRSRSCPSAVEGSAAHGTGPDGRGETCQKHKREELRFFCEPCGLPVCRDCRVTSHFQHSPVIDLVDASQQAAAKLQDDLEDLNTRIGSLETQVESLSNKREHAAQTKREVETLVISRAKEIISLVKQYKDQVLTRLEEEASSLDEAFDSDIVKAAEELSSLSDARSRVTRCLDNGRDLELLRLEAEMRNLLRRDGGPANADSQSGQGLAAGVSPPTGFYLNGSDGDSSTIASLIFSHIGELIQLGKPAEQNLAMTQPKFVYDDSDQASL
ncbi:hypothetical protein BaRGS_00016821 [Batillaria attramentaria]|uniref:Uncharacterized protein n=1 Tax=Batillaria attramentaria TaxID=370345 RepID=A0ABD0KXQ8_9CAEN